MRWLCESAYCFGRKSEIGANMKTDEDAPARVVVLKVRGEADVVVTDRRFLDKLPSWAKGEAK